MTTVVDASVVVDWVAPDVATTAPALALLDRLAAPAEPLVGSRLLLHEVGSALLTGVRRGRWDGAEADAAYAHLRRLPVTLVDLPGDGGSSLRAVPPLRRARRHS